MIFTAGIVGWDEHESFPEYTLHGQFARALRNTLAILAEDGAGPEHIVRMTCYVTDRHEYVELARRDRRGVARDHGRRTIRRWRWSRSRAWSKAAAKVEIETTAVVAELSDARTTFRS